MTTIRAALVKEVGRLPVCETTTLKERLPNQVQVKVVASGVHQLVKALASGQHYAAGGQLPMVPGVDGSGYLPNGDPVYFISFMDRQSTGAMASLINIDQSCCLPVPPNADLKKVAALANPAMSSWLALRCRAAQPLPRDFQVLIIGATGASGQLAIQIARQLGASRVIGTARNATLLNELANTSNGLDVAIPLPATDDDEAAFQERIGQETTKVDVVLDYLGGHPAELCLRSMVPLRQDKQQRLDFVQIGSMAGPDVTVPASALRSANFYVSGSGLGSITPTEMKQQLAELVQHLGVGTLDFPIVEKDVSQVEQVWNERTDGRLVLTFEQ
ncbi:NAD(P)-binding protein [Hesseltinella vesiculosa]|uniref:NAD(P)-binding protein n=1 Tax=Hesseltinella vesiculosa TaxID=101127 RepID=A0A1X2G4V6_9FUNG|nr:NAD(P)-binding protein [Hesseltinella vesiculosa]